MRFIAGSSCRNASLIAAPFAIIAWLRNMYGMQTERFEMRLPDALIQRIDRWRLAQPIVPSRAAAIRYLVERALAIMEGKA